MFRWFKKAPPASTPAPEAEVLDRDPYLKLETAELLTDVPMQTRRAQQVAAAYASAIRSTCEQLSEVGACYVLDMRRLDKEGQWLLIEVALKDPSQLEKVAKRLAIALNQFPAWQRTYVRLADKATIERHNGAEFYRCA